MAELSRGANAPIAGTNLQLAVSGARQGAVDLMVFQLGADRKVRSDADFVFFNQPASPEGAVRLTSADAVSIDLASVPASVETLAVAVSLDDSVPGSLAAITGLGVQVGGPSDAHSAPAVGLTTERAAVLVEIYRRQGAWKVRNVSAGWSSGLPALAREHGVQVDDAPPAAAPPPAPAPPSGPAYPAPGAWGGVPSAPPAGSAYPPPGSGQYQPQYQQPPAAAPYPYQPAGGNQALPPMTPAYPPAPAQQQAAQYPPTQNQPAQFPPAQYQPTQNQPGAYQAPAVQDSGPPPGAPQPGGFPLPGGSPAPAAQPPVPPTVGGFPPPGGDLHERSAPPPAVVGGFPPPGNG
jgi:stress response protein SCP2